MSYRPKGWKNPYPLSEEAQQKSYAQIPEDGWYYGYEAGATAMLEALKKEGRRTNGTAPTLSINVLPEQTGWLVFIPEEVL